MKDSIHSIGPEARSRRVVVSGLGALTPLGASLAETCAALARGESAPRSPVPGAPGLFAAPAREYDARAHFRFPKALKLADRKCRLAVAAAAQAVADAGLAEDRSREGWAVVLGCSASNLQVDEIARALAAPGGPEAATADADDVSRFASCVLDGLNPLWLLINLPNMVGAHAGIQLEMNGPNQTVTGDRIAGAQAIGEAYLAIAAGECDVAVAGGADSPLDPFDLGCFASERPDGAPPRLLSEAAAVLLLEERERALARGARIYGEVAGFASAPSAEMALRRAARASQQGDEGGVGGETARLDWTEAIGDTLAAAGALEAALLLAGARGRSARLLALVVGAAGQSAALRFVTEPGAAASAA